MTLSLETALHIAKATLQKGKALKLAPLSVAILDSGGHLIAFKRQDGSSTMRPQIAIGKASSALALGVSSRKIAEMATERPTFIASLGPIASAGIIPAAGGLLITDEEGTLLGAVGVTGDTSDHDEECALAGLKAAGLSSKD